MSVLAAFLHMVALFAASLCGFSVEKDYGASVTVFFLVLSLAICAVAIVIGQFA